MQAKIRMKYSPFSQRIVFHFESIQRHFHFPHCPVCQPCGDREDGPGHPERNQCLMSTAVLHVCAQEKKGEGGGEGGDREREREMRHV